MITACYYAYNRNMTITAGRREEKMKLYWKKKYYITLELSQ